MTGFHEGELAVQERAGGRAAADRLSGMLAPADLGGGLGRFLGEFTFAAVTAQGPDGRLWISPLTGPRGFLQVTGPVELQIHAAAPVGDPLHDVPAGQQVGLVAIDFARRRRVRLNGRLDAVTDTGLAVGVEQAYGNCPQHIRPRTLHAAVGQPPADVHVVQRPALHAADIALIERSDTFLLGSTHPQRGRDASHRGGPAGFVRVDGEQALSWPDYPGNGMFNSLGNLAADPAVALLFLDFATGAALHVSGTATLEWDVVGADDGGSGRRVRVRVDSVVSGPGYRR